MENLESQIAEWRAYVAAAPAVGERDADELESHLRDRIVELTEAGLSEDEAFLIAVKRMGDLHSLSREFAREHSGRLWKQLVLSDTEQSSTGAGSWVEALVFAVCAGIVVQIARLLAGSPDEDTWLFRNLGLLILPFLALYFARRRAMNLRGWLLTAAPFAVGALVVNLYPFDEGSSTETLVALHLPIALWFGIAYPYAGGDVGSHDRRMDFVRFTGEWIIYYTLIALGGGVLLALTALILNPIGSDLAESVFEWVLPMGAAGAVVIAAWLVESKQQVVENMAPVLTAVFTPLFAIMLVLSAITYAAFGVAEPFDRELLAVFDALLVVVLGLVVYAMSARDPMRAAGLMDRVQLVAVVSALFLDVMVLGSMLVRVGDLGFTPNRVAALGLNILLLVNLAGAAWLSFKYLRGHATHNRLERWQISYLPAFALWTMAMVIVLPPAFSFS